MNLLLTAFVATATLINSNWTFSLGSGKGMEEDFTHGTEYFTYVAKARSTNHNHGPIMPEFDDSSWQKVSLPHDWAVDLPYSGEASHSHGYKCLGWKYPQNNVGWYRKHLEIPAEWKGCKVWVVFEGIYRNSQVFVNGYYMGGRDDGYLRQVYDISDYLEYGSDNLLAVRCDASLEEGWYYEGAGIYRNVWLQCSPELSIVPGGVKTVQSYDAGSNSYTLDINLTLSRPAEEGTVIKSELLDGSGNVIACGTMVPDGGSSAGAKGAVCISDAREWDIEDPYLYCLRTIVSGECPDTSYTRVGFRRVEFSPENGLSLNGRKTILKGCNLHQDHAGAGSGIPDELWRYRLLQLKKYGFNAIRSSHNPATPAMLDLCDELGFVVIDENREFGSSQRQLGKLDDMILRDINHPCIILWSVGNEEWALEWSPRGAEIAAAMCWHAHLTDPSRQCTYGSSGGRELVKGADVFGYNYIVQNPVTEYHESFRYKTAVGTEETSGAGTRGEYATVPEEGWMQPLNRRDTLGYVNAIERGWKFYHENSWTCGLFYWTGFDYRGEPNPMVWPATGSQFGILDYCGYPKDEAYYLKSWWVPEETTIHLCGLSDGQVWVYSNCTEVELFMGRKSLGKKAMPEDGHLSWDVEWKGSSVPAGIFRAVGTRRGVKGRFSDSWPAAHGGTSFTLSKDSIRNDGQDLVVVDIDSWESTLDVEVSGICLLGWGNGNPGFKDVERPQNGSTALAVKPFNGKCQVLLRSIEGSENEACVKIQGREIRIPYCASR